MRKAEKKAFFVKITEYLGNVLTRMNEIDQWTDKEIYEKCAVPQNRISEIKYFERYGRPVNEKYLGLFIGGGIITMAELEKKLKLDENEMKFLKEIVAFHGSKDLRDTVVDKLNSGVSMETILNALKKL